MSSRAPSAGLVLLRDRLLSIPDALRQAASGPAPELRGAERGGFVVTGIGSSAAHARFLVHLIAGTLGLRARFATPGEFVATPGARAGNETLVVFSQGLSPNARFALTHARRFDRVVLVTSTPADGGLRQDAPQKRALLEDVEVAGGLILRLPGADEYGTLLRVVGPMVGYVAALRIARALGPEALPLEIEDLVSAVSAAPARLDARLRGPEESIAFVALGATAELVENLRFKILEGLRRPAPPVWDLLHFAHGPWQQLHDHPGVLLALTHSGVASESHLLALAETLLVPGRHRLLRLEARLAAPLGIFEHEALVNELVLRAIEAEGLDPARWPGDDRESALYRSTPARRDPRPDPVPAQAPTSRALRSKTWPEVDALLASGHRTAVIPLGALEQHGPHLPLDTDTRIADALAERFCDAVPEAIRLPALWAGCSREHLAFAGTIDLRATTLEAVLVDLVDSLVRHGFDRLLVFSAHGGNDAALSAMLPALRAAASPARITVVAGLGRIAALQARASATEGVEAPAAGQHAGEHETSILLGLDPASVRRDRLEPGLLEIPEDAQSLFYPSLRAAAPNGVVGDPRPASGARAERYLAAWISLLVEAYRAEKNAK